ncbi:D-amino-acid transaminase, chloroplastic-like protein [Cinnamomum micranthum f. kanehirae]|uniref:D-amino-acid transaminase, chloroplastic-like protein n=1 Tax=Cinnamomum micranthum f. kanehirae TaxID=337451 RepID=A0A443N1Q8_9MAGN|nr:D-amino-acid transaminase, chloroplastic-like protein [Cinnamomum micranthum f. kanehirae]
MASSIPFPHQPISENPFPSTIVSSSSVSSHIGRSIGLPGVTSRVFPLRVSRGSSGKVRAAEISNQTRDSTNLRSVDLQMTEVPLLSSSEVVERLKTYQENRKSTQHYLAMYSSIFGGITTDPAAMVISLDDHMVHRGHGVFDTAAIMDGHLYELDQHIERFLKSASMAKIAPPFDPSSIRNVLIQTVSASKCMRGSLRYWLSAGPGDFQLSPSGCSTPALYAVVYQDQSPPYKKGVKVITSSIPMKPPQFAIMKSVNYLPNVLSKMEAEEKGAFAAIWLDDEGNVAEGPNMNVAFVTTDKELVMPYFDNILSGCTAKRVVVLAKKLVKEGRLAGIRVGDITMQEGKMAEEMMLIGSGILVLPVLQWDEQIIGNGKEGAVAQELLELIQEDMKAGPSAVRIPIPY